MRKLNSFGMAICLAWSFFILFSCAKDPTEVERTPTSTFPLTEGSRWEYSGLWYTVPIDSSFSADTIDLEIYRHIIGRDTLPGITGLIVCDDTIISYLPDEVYTSVFRRWLKVEDNKLQSMASVLFQIGEDPNPVIFDSPRILLDFPLNVGKVWDSNHTEFGPSGYELRQIVGIDYIEIPGGWQYCDVLRSDVFDILDTIQSAYEWYNDDGLMRLEIDYGFHPIAPWRMLELWELIDYEIQP